MVGLLSSESYYGRPIKMRNSVLEGLQREEIGRHPVGYVCSIVFIVSDVMRETQS